MPAPATVAPDASGLCTACGLCCDGTIFGNARAYPDDLPNLAAHGVPLDTETERLMFRLPCPRLSGACCTIYDERFTTCRIFRCTLLQKLDAGEIDLTRGLEVIANARTLVDALPPAVHDVRERQAELRATARWNEIGDLEQRFDMAERHFAMVAAERYLTQHFRKPSDVLPDVDIV